MAPTKLKKTIANLSTIDPEFAEFLKQEDEKLLDFDVSDDDEESEEENEERPRKRQKLEKPSSKKQDSEEGISDEDDEEDGGSDEDEGSGDGEDGESDDEEDDKSDVEMEERDEGEQDSDDDDDDKGRKPYGDDDDDDDKDSCTDDSFKKKKKPGQIAVTLKLIEKWNNLIQGNLHEGLKELSEAFKAAVRFNSPPKDGEASSKYIVESISVYNAIISTCIVDLVPELLKHLALPAALKKKEKSVLPSMSNKWKKIKLLLKPYLLDVLQLLDQISSGESREPVMKHLLELTLFFACYPKLVKPFLKKMIELWSSSPDETIRILALRCLINIIPTLNEKTTKFAFTNLYLKAKSNCYYTSVISLPAINFIKKSLVELFSLNAYMAYRCAFTFLQKTTKNVEHVVKFPKKEDRKSSVLSPRQAISDWQTCHSLSMWAGLLGKNKDDKYLKTLVGPLVAAILTIIQLNHAPASIPLRFHYVRILIELCQSTGLYVPMLPILLQPLRSKLFLKEPKQSKMKHCVFSVCLKMSKEEREEKAFRDAAMDEITELILEYCSWNAHRISFPEHVANLVDELRTFTKQSKARIYVKKIKLVLQKIQSTCEQVKKRRRESTIDLRDATTTEIVEEKLKAEGSDVKTYYDDWMKVRVKQTELLLSKDMALADEDAGTKVEDQDKNKTKKENSKKDKRVEKKNKKKKTGSDSEYSDFDEDELEALARSPVSDCGDEEEEESKVHAEDYVATDDIEDDVDDRPDVVRDLNLDDDSSDSDDDEEIENGCETDSDENDCENE